MSKVNWKSIADGTVKLTVSSRGFFIATDSKKHEGRGRSPRIAIEAMQVFTS